MPPLRDARDQVVIRPTTDADAPSLRDCLDTVARERRFLLMIEAPPLDAVATFRRALRDDGGIDLVAVDADDRVIGWIDMRRHPWPGVRHAGTLGMGVHPDHRGAGIGRALVEAALEAAQAAGIVRVELEAVASNVPAIALYERMGFVHEGRKVGARVLDGVTDDFVMMARHATRP